MAKRVGERRLHLIDAENLVGSGGCSEMEVLCVHEAYRPLVGGTDLVLVASSHFNQVAVGFGWRGGLHLVRSGLSGADYALIEAYQELPNPGSFAGLVIGSGDGIFGDVALDAVRRGMTVSVVVGAGGLSKRLKMMAKEVISLNVVDTGYDGTHGSAA